MIFSNTKCPACDTGTLAESDQFLCAGCNAHMHRADEIEDAMRAAQPIVLIANNCTFRHGCAICRESCKDSEIPAWLATRIGDLCYRCAKSRAPELVVIAQDLAILTWGCDGDSEAERPVLTRSVVRGMDAAALDPDSAAVTDERPASLLNGVAPIAQLGSPVSTVLGQVQDMLEALVDGGSDLDSAVFGMHPYEAIRLSSLVTTEGVRAFPELTAVGGSILGIPAVVSIGCARSGSPSERVFAVVDGAQILVADDNGVEVSASNVASLQMDDATVQDARDGTGSTVVSLFQTDTTAVRVGRTINWERAQAAAVAWCTVA